MLNLTHQERLVIQFLIAFFLIGTAMHFYKEKTRQPDDALISMQSKEASQFRQMAQRVDSLYAATEINEASKPRKAEKPAKPKTVSRPVKLNTASKEDLMSLPRIGSVTADSIINFRTKNGKFSTLEDLLKIKGISEKTLERIKGEVTIE